MARSRPRSDPRRLQLRARESSRPPQTPPGRQAPNRGSRASHPRSRPLRLPHPLRRHLLAQSLALRQRPRLASLPASLREALPLFSHCRPKIWIWSYRYPQATVPERREPFDLANHCLIAWRLPRVPARPTPWMRRMMYTTAYFHCYSGCAPASSAQHGQQTARYLLRGKVASGRNMLLLYDLRMAEYSAVAWLLRWLPQVIAQQLSGVARDIGPQLVEGHAVTVVERH